jgi:tetratricopeptide (TPR) repeat protein
LTQSNLESLQTQAEDAFELRDFKRAETIVREILGASQSSVAALVLLGRIACATARPELGFRLFSKAVRVDSLAYVRLKELTLRIRSNGTAEAVALCHHVLRLDPQDAAAYFNLGLCLLSINRSAEAIGPLGKAISLSPDEGAYYHHLGFALQSEGRFPDAIGAYSRAIELSPECLDAYLPLATLLIRSGEKAAAIATFRQAYNLLPESDWGRMHLARALIEEENFTDAAVCLRRLTQGGDASGDSSLLLGNILQRLGRFEEAIAAFDEALAENAKCDEALVGLAYSRRIREVDRSLAIRLADRLSHAPPNSRRRRTLHYALGKVLDELADYGQAIHHFNEANRISADEMAASGRVFDCERHAAEVDLMVRTFKKGFLARRPEEGRESELPVLIVGLPRSGTTLVEQIVSSHSRIAAGGELAFWPGQGDRFVKVGNGYLSEAGLETVAEDYVALLCGIDPDALRVTDKLPNNYLRLGLAFSALPKARVIHCRRDPIDTCLSIYFTPFRNSLNFAHSRESLVFLCGQYLRLMDHWRTVLPSERFLEVDYESLVSDREAVTRKMIAFCGLEWEGACLNHESNPHAVTTPSMWQVRQPIYETSVGRWKNYEPWLGPFATLKDTARTGAS